jgi:hypothetical protein
MGMQAEKSGCVGMAQKAQTAGGILIFVARAFASSLEVTLRRNFGSRYFGMHALGTLVSVPLWMAFWNGEDTGPLVWFWWFMVLMFLRARVETARMTAKGVVVHTRYNGWPRLASTFKKMSAATWSSQP